MIFPKRFFIGLVTASILLNFTATALTSAVTAGDWKAGRIIDDGMFTNSTDMSVAGIQAFLNARVPVCDTWGNQTSEYYAPDYNGDGRTTRAEYATYRGYSTPFTCLKDYYEVPKTSPGAYEPSSNYGGVAIPPGAQSAAQIISNAAYKYNINPKVLLVKLATESPGPLTTDDWPFKRQYLYAMGAHCPDSGPGGAANCDPDWAGFSLQMDEAASLLRWYLDSMTQSWWQYKKPYQNNNILWNVVETGCGGSNVYIETKATAALYTYTPYQPNQAALNNMYGTGDGCSAYGNRNFWRVWYDWFGSTQFPQPAGGSLYYQQSSGKIYLVVDTTRYYIPSWDMMTNYGLDAYPLQSVSDTTIQGLSDGGSLTNLIWDDGGVFLVNNRFRHHVSGEMCAAWGLSCFDNTQVKSLGSVFQTQYLRQGGELTSISYANGVAYSMSAGNRRPVANQKSLTDLNLNTIPGLVASSVNSRQPLGNLLITTPGVLQFGASSPLYYFDGSAYYRVQDMNVYNDWSLGSAPYLSIPESSYNTIPPSFVLLNSWAVLNGQKYVVDQKRKLLITDSTSNLWPDDQFAAPPVSLFNSLPTVNLTRLIWADPYIYYLDAGKKHYVSTYDDFVSLQATNGTAISIRSSKVNPITQGSDAITDGQIVSVQDGSGKIYVVNQHKLTYIPGPSVFDAYGYGWGAIRQYPPSIATDYPIDGTSLIHGRTSDGTIFVVSGSKLYTLSAGQARDYGAIASKFTPITRQVVKANSKTLSRFLYNVDNGRVYYASGEAIHYVASYSAFVAYGGTTTPIHSVNTASIDLFIEAQPVY